MSLYLTPAQEHSQVPATLYVPDNAQPQAAAMTPQPVNGFLPNLSDNEKRLIAIGVIGIVGWFLFGDKIKAKLKR
jgi:hypothetical protein